MQLEKRTRVEIFLPISSDLLLSQTMTAWLADELAYAHGGATLTSPFMGVYLPSVLGDIVRDKIQVLFCDFYLDLENKEDHLNLATYVGHLRLSLKKILKEEEVWITCHPVMRAAG